MRSIKSIGIANGDNITTVTMTYEVEEHGEMVEKTIEWKIDESGPTSLYPQLNTDLACILYRVLQCISSYEAADILKRPRKGEIVFSEHAVSGLPDTTVTRVEVDGPRTIYSSDVCT